MTRHSIIATQLENQGLLSHTIGSVPSLPNPAIVIWGKHAPRHDNLPLLMLSSLITDVKPTIYVDDIASQVFCGRTYKEQEKYNKLYTSFFANYKCEVYFSSDLYQEEFGADILTPLLSIASRVSTSGFIRDLPENKKTIYQKLPASEIMNALLELLLFEQVSKKHNSLVIRHFTQGIVWNYLKIAKKPLAAFVVPRLEGEKAIDEYLSLAKSHYRDIA